MRPSSIAATVGVCASTFTTGEGSARRPAPPFLDGAWRNENFLATRSLISKEQKLDGPDWARGLDPARAGPASEASIRPFEARGRGTRPPLSAGGRPAARADTRSGRAAPPGRGRAGARPPPRRRYHT